MYHNKRRSKFENITDKSKKGQYYYFEGDKRRDGVFKTILYKLFYIISSSIVPNFFSIISNLK